MWCSDTRFPLDEFPLVPVDQIEQREKKNPHNVDEVPVQADQLDWSVVPRRETAAQRLLNEPQKQAGADDHVQRVKAGHGEVQGEEKLGVGIGGHISARLEIEIPARDMVLHVLVVILDGFNA